MDEWRGLPVDVKSLVQGVFGYAQQWQALADMAAALVKWTVENAASFKGARTRIFQERA